MNRKAPTGRRLVRAERIDTANGSIGHMSVDQIRVRLIGKDINVSCPECGGIHLTPEEAEEAEARKMKRTGLLAALAEKKQVP